MQDGSGPRVSGGWRDGACRAIVPLAVALAAALPPAAARQPVPGAWAPPAPRQEPPPDQGKAPRERVTMGGATLELELAADPATRGRGLSGRSEIAEHGGMLFVFPGVAHRSFWMKDCLVDIDLAFLDERGRIVSLHRMLVEPPRRSYESNLSYERRLRGYPSRRRCQFAIELRAGSIESLHLQVGQAIELDRERLRKLAR